VSFFPDSQEGVDRLPKKQSTILARNEIRSIAAIKKKQEANSLVVKPLIQDY
jgi:hypothetical protein